MGCLCTEVSGSPVKSVPKILERRKDGSLMLPFLRSLEIRALVEGAGTSQYTGIPSSPCISFS